MDRSWAGSPTAEPDKAIEDAGASSDAQLGLDGFVSYSRVDADHVWEIVAEAKARGRTLWIDSDGIPPGAPWREELGTAIEAADAFICILTPHWTRSKECELEFKRARELGKRIIPVLVADTKPVPAELAPLQWIDARSGPAGDVAEAILRAVRVDYERVREHTEWLARAVRWQARNEERSALLRGAELRAAEAWLQHGGVEPSPVPLQRRYIESSRREERARTRRRNTAIAIGTGVALVLGVLALLQTVASNANRRQAQSRALAAAALAQVQVDPQRALLLARAAWKLSPTGQALNALEVTLNASRLRVAIRAFSGFAYGVAWGPADSSLVAGGGGEIAAWSSSGALPLGWLPNGAGVRFASDASGAVGLAVDALGRAVMWAVSGPTPRLHLVRELVDNGGTAGAISADGSRAAVALRNGIVSVWDTRAFTQRRIATGIREPTCLASSPAGGLVAVGGVDRVAVLDAGTGALIRSVRLTSSVAVCEFNRAGSLLTVGQDGSGSVQQPATGALVVALHHVFAAALDPTGRFVGTTDIHGGVRIYDVTMRRWTTLQAGGALEDALAFSDDGATFAAGGVDGVIHLWNTTPGTPPTTLRGAAGNILAISFSHDGRYVATADSSGRVSTWQVSTSPVPLAVQAAGATRSDVTSVAFDPTGSTVVTTSDFVWSASDRTGSTACPGTVRCSSPTFALESLALMILAAEGIPDDAVYSRDGRLAVASRSGHIGVWNPAAGAELAGAPPSAARVDDVAFSPDGRLLVVSDREGVARLVDPGDGRVVASMRRDDQAVYAVAFVEGGRDVVSAGSSGKLWLWDDHGHFLRTLTDLHGAVFALAPEPGGGSVAAAVGNQIIVVNVPSGSVIESLSAHSGDITSLAFGDQREFLVAGSADGQVTIWDLRARADAVTLGLPAAIRSVAFDRADRLIAAATAGAGAYVMGCDICQPPGTLAALAAARSTRALTRQERQEFGVS